MTIFYQLKLQKKNKIYINLKITNMYEIIIVTTYLYSFTDASGTYIIHFTYKYKLCDKYNVYHELYQVIP